MKRSWICFVCLFLLCGCSIQKDDMEKLRDIDFTVIDEAKLPEELKQRRCPGCVQHQPGKEDTACTQQKQPVHHFFIDMHIT